MSRGLLNLSMQGRFGNMMFQYAFARAYAEKYDLELHTEPWVGQKIFTIDDPVNTPGPVPRILEKDIQPGMANVEFRGYFQRQEAMLYTREQVLRWFRFRPHIIMAHHMDSYPLVAHRRVGDYLGYGYPVVGRQAYLCAAERAGYEPRQMLFISDEHPTIESPFLGELEFVHDFITLTKAQTLFRSNSSFSWWAATLGVGRVFSPVIDGLEGGKVHETVPFVEGNHPRLANLDFVTDLHLPK